MSLPDFFIAHKREVLTLTAEHLWLVGISMLLAVAIGVPLGILLSRRPGWKTLVLGGSNLTMYALLPVVRNTYVGIAGVDAPVREAAIGMGLTPRQLLWQVELPLASNVIVAGIRTATVITVGVATIAAAIGAGGLGEFIFRGLAMVDNNVILAGAIPAALMALSADTVLALIQRTLVRTHH
jgi:osmoprotectant transport system permease protein